jgi:hypothetical protein
MQIRGLVRLALVAADGFCDQSQLKTAREIGIFVLIFAFQLRKIDASSKDRTS